MHGLTFGCHTEPRRTTEPGGQGARSERRRELRRSRQRTVGARELSLATSRGAYISIDDSYPLWHAGRSSPPDRVAVDIGSDAMGARHEAAAILAERNAARRKETCHKCCFLCCSLGLFRCSLLRFLLSSIGANAEA